MNRKERVMRAIRHQEPDRVPVDYGANQGIQTRLMTISG
jgi:hypothetical protein